MREVDLELDFCPKCAPEETQNPFPVQEHRFYNSFAAVVQCTRCGTHYAACTIVSTANIILWSRVVRSSKNSLLSFRCCSRS